MKQFLRSLCAVVMSAVMMMSMPVYMTGCASFTRNFTVQREEWTVVFQPKWCIPSKLMYNEPEQKLWRARVERAAMKTLRELYKPWTKISFVQGDEIPATGNVIEVKDRLEAVEGGWILGRADGIDEGNRKVNRLYGEGLGIFGGSLYVALFHDAQDNPDLCGHALGVILAHEIGHALGLWHVHANKPYIMAIGSPYPIPFRVLWSPQSEAYLDRVFK